MKKIITYLSLILLSSSLWSCKDSGSPEAITELFLISSKNLDFVTLKTISTKNTNTVLKILEHYTADSLVAQKWHEKYDDMKIKILSKQIEYDTIAYVTFTTDPVMYPTQEFKLIQITEKLDKKSWKVDISTIEIYEKLNANSDTSQYNVSHDGQINLGADSIAVEE